MNLIRITDEGFGVNTYLVEENRHCFLIDPIISRHLVHDIKNKLIIDYVFLTHEHYDHISGINKLREQYNIMVLCGEKAAERLKDPAQNLSRYQDYIVQVVPFGNGKTGSEEYVCFADKIVKDGEVMTWQNHKLLFKETPGHSIGSIALLMDDEKLFTGDIIFKGFPTATQLPGGSSKSFWQITEPWLNSLPQNIIVYPGHTDPFQLRERYKP